MKLHRLLILALAFPLALHAQVTVFNDTFGNGSALNPSNPPGGPVSYPTPTANSTGYEIASSKTSTTSIGPNDLKIQIASTTSGLIEAQALFTSTPVQLSADGQYVRLTTTFTATQNILIAPAGTTSSINQGLFYSNGSAPLSGLQSSGLNGTAGSPYASGGAQPWQGVNSRFAFTGGTNNIVTRPVQNPSSGLSTNQDLLFNAASASTAYSNPAGTSLGSAGSTLTLTQGSQYTMDLRLTFSSATGLLTINSNLFSGTDTTATPLVALANSTSDPTLPLQYDGLAIGFRYTAGTGPGTPIILDLNSIMVTTNVPEPSTWAMTVGGIGMLMGLRRRVGKV